MVKKVTKKVVILGTESTGKSTLTRQLGTYFQVPIILEAARDIIANSNNFPFEDLNKSLAEQTLRIEQVLKDSPSLVIMDTDLNTLQSYANFSFKESLRITTHHREVHKADLYLYLNNDVPFVQDGTRFTENVRNKLDKSHRQILKDNQIFYHEIKGDWEDRFNTAVWLIRKLGSNNDV